MNNQIILLLGANQFLRERALAGARQITKAGIWIADESTKTHNNRYFDGCLEASPYDAEAIIKQIQQILNKQLLSVVPLNDWVLETANRVNAHFGLPSLSSRTLLRTRNKYEMKQCFAKANIPAAKHYLLTDDDELDAALNQVGLPAIIKPYDFGGSGGVFVANNLDEAKKFLAESRALIARHKDAFKIHGDKYLIEEYINSRDEVSVEVICFNGSYKTIAVTEKYLSPEPWFSELAHLVPSHRNNDRQLRTLAEKTCEALGIEFGMAHVEIKIRDGQFFVIEAAARPGGDGIMDQVERAFGINPYALHIGAYLGMDTTRTAIPEPTGTAAIAFLKARQGTITKINPPDHILQDDHLLSLQLYTQVGKTSEAPKDWSTREGVVEFFWPDHFETQKTQRPMQKAQQITDQLFEVK